MSTVAPPTNERVVAILRAACRVAAREGAHGLRMATVASEAGVSKALVHYYFSTRHELLRAAFAFSEDRLNDALREQLEGLATGAERVDRALIASFDPEGDVGEQRALWNEVWSSLHFDDELQPAVRRYYRAWVERLAELVEQGRADGSIPASVDADQTAWRLGALADGLDSMLYLGLLTRTEALGVARGALARELAG
jgi:AcrR family transcriptional regulator